MRSQPPVIYGVAPQQIGLTIGGVMVSQGELKVEQEGSFAPLGHRAIPSLNAGDWDTLTAALPDIEQFSATAPRATVVDVAAKKP